MTRRQERRGRGRSRRGRTGGPRAVAVAGVLALAGGLVACFSGIEQIGAPSSPTRFYSLSAMAPAGEPVEGVDLGLSPVRVPEYLDRPQIVTRPGPNDLALADFDRWAEPVQAAVSRVLALDLARRLGLDRVQRYPWRDAGAVETAVDVDLLRLEGPLDGPVELEALWQLRLPGGRVDGVTRTREAVEGSGYSAYVAALSRALATLSGDIADAIRAHRGS